LGLKVAFRKLNSHRSLNLLTDFVSIMVQWNIIGQNAVYMLGLDSLLEIEGFAPGISFICGGKK